MNKIILEESMVSICARHSICLKRKTRVLPYFSTNITLYQRHVKQIKAIEILTFDIKKKTIKRIKMRILPPDARFTATLC